MSQDREFEIYIEGKSELSHVYRAAPQAEPPDRLDAAILAEARRAVGARPGGARKRRWVMPLSMVASLFVALMVGLQLPELLQEPVVRQIAQNKPDVPMADTAAAPAPVLQLEKSASLPERKRTAVAAQPKEEAYKPAPMQADKAAKPSFAPAAPEPQAPAAPPAVASGRLDVRRAPAARAAAPQEAAAAAEQARLMEQAESDHAGARAKAESVARVEDSAGVLPEQPAPVVAREAAPAPAKMADALGAAQANAISQRPEDWLARIKQLRQQGKPDEAAKELAAFRKRYPDYPVPRDVEAR